MVVLTSVSVPGVEAHYSLAVGAVVGVVAELMAVGLALGPAAVASAEGPVTVAAAVMLVAAPRDLLCVPLCYVSP